jgi:hypothetical protein
MPNEEDQMSFEVWCDLLETELKIALEDLAKIRKADKAQAKNRCHMLRAALGNARHYLSENSGQSQKLIARCCSAESGEEAIVVGSERRFAAYPEILDLIVFVTNIHGEPRRRESLTLKKSTPR